MMSNPCVVIISIDLWGINFQARQFNFNCDFLCMPQFFDKRSAYLAHS